MKNISVDDIILEQTCGACPEQYDAWLGDQQVGYLRLRHGHFRVDFPRSGGEIIYRAHPQGDGIFQQEERAFFLTEAKKAIIDRLTMMQENTPLSIPDKHPYPHPYPRYEWPNKIVEAYQQRERWTIRGMFAFVCWDWVQPLSSWIGRRKVLEVMAGAGWLARALSEKNIDITATDDHSWIEKKGWPLQHPVEQLDAVSAIEKYGAAADLLIISWPYMEPAAFETVRKWNEVNPDGLIIYIGEQEGGCNADQDFFEHFEEVSDESFHVVGNRYRTWEGLHDTIVLGKYKP